ncbi:hypothetical protein [Streptomyces sp. NPDC090022]|uniref:hypothetical protein n=1 Tax=Streptomyces sp. NPDC090022 TaxID=3365920 RepID=UPI0038080029
MISEPELDGPYEEPDRPGEPDPAPPPAAPAAHRRRPWLWALGGALTASAVWAGGLYAVGEQGSLGPARYRWAEYLCDDFTAPALSRFAGVSLPGRKLDNNRQHPVLDWTGCRLSASAGSVLYEVTAEVALHHRTDPGPEFEVDQAADPWLEQDAVTVENVPGLGERAELRHDGPFDRRTLRVVDGQAVFTMNFSAVRDYRDSPPEKVLDPSGPGIDFAAARTALIEDMRTLMAALRI